MFGMEHNLQYVLYTALYIMQYATFKMWLYDNTPLICLI